MSLLDERRLHPLFEEGDQAGECPGGPVEVDDDETGIRPQRAGWLRGPVFERQASCQHVDRTERPEQVHVVVVPYHGVRRDRWASPKAPP